jgi:hypothetical protein
MQAGTPATAFTSLLIRTVLAVATKHNFPPPDGGQWTGEKASEVAHSFIAHDRTPGILEALVLTCADDRALAGALQGVIRNFLRDRGRATEMGRLVVRLRRALKNTDLFIPVGGDRWALLDGPVPASQVGPDILAAAAATVRIKFQPWSPTARRRHPFADRVSIDALVTAVLTAAQGSLRPSDIAHAIAPSLQVITGNMLVELDSGDPPDAGADTPGLDLLGADVVNRARAFEVFGLLTDREKITLAYPELDTRKLAPLIGLGHSQAAVVRNKAIELLQEELGNEENGQDIAELVLEITKFWVDHRTEPGDVTYNSA